MGEAFTRVGKQILALGVHYADGADERAAEHILSRLTGWRRIEDLPSGPCNVLLICPPFQWTDQDGNPVAPDPMRDHLERMELGFWDGEMWCESGTGHEIERELRPDHLFPSHWMPLPTPPVEA